MTRRKKQKTELPDLSRLERDIMNVVWELDCASSAEVIAEYTKTRRLADTTVRTVLANLRKKGYLTPVPTIERGFRLRATISRENVAKRTLKDLVTGLLKGSPRDAIACLLSHADLDDADLDVIGAMIEARRGEENDK